MFVFQVEIVLNFFPGDHSTADKYKRFVQKLTKVMFVLIMMMIIIMKTLFVLFYDEDDEDAENVGCGIDKL